MNKKFENLFFFYFFSIQFETIYLKAYVGINIYICFWIQIQQKQSFFFAVIVDAMEKYNKTIKDHLSKDWIE